MKPHERFAVWVLTGPVGRGIAFVADFTVAVARAALGRMPGVRGR